MFFFNQSAAAKQRARSAQLRESAIGSQKTCSQSTVLNKLIQLSMLIFYWPVHLLDEGVSSREDIPYHLKKGMVCRF
jgi:hypothetical protein